MSSNSIRSAERRTPINDGDLPLMGAVPQGQRRVNAVDLSRGQFFLDLLKDAIDGAYSHKAAASDMGLDKAQLSRELAGDGHLSIRRVAMLPDYVHCSFAGRIQTHYGADDRVQRIERAMEMIEKGRSMLAAEASR